MIKSKTAAPRPNCSSGRSDGLSRVAQSCWPSPPPRGALHPLEGAGERKDGEGIGVVRRVSNLYHRKVAKLFLYTLCQHNESCWRHEGYSKHLAGVRLLAFYHVRACLERSERSDQRVLQLAAGRSTRELAKTNSAEKTPTAESTATVATVRKYLLCDSPSQHVWPTPATFTFLVNIYDSWAHFTLCCYQDYGIKLERVFKAELFKINK